MKRIVLATNNMGKLREVRSLFPTYEVLTLKDIGFMDDIVEDGKTFEENAIIKAKTISLKYNCITLADDSGLSVEALDGAPGIYSARYSLEQTDESNNALLIKNLEGKENRRAKYVCALCVFHPNGEFKTVCETCEGLIIDDARGTNGFGYDPHFYIPSLGKTFAEVSLEEKNKLSHRAKALRKLKEICNEDFSFK